MTVDIRSGEASVNGKEDRLRISMRSESAQEVISKRKGFVDQWALLFFLSILLIVLGGAWFIKYPDLIEANAILLASNTPKEIVIRQEGKLIKLIAANDEMVEEGQIIGWMESIGSHQIIVKLSESLKKAIGYLNLNEPQSVSNLFLNRMNGNIGELQISYQQFMVSLQQFNDYIVNGYYYRLRSNLFEDYMNLKRMHENLELQNKFLLQDVALSQETFEANDSLFKEKVISRQEYRDQKAKFVNKQISIPQLQSSILSNENEQIAKQKEIDELEHTISQAKAVFQEALLTFKSSVDDWIRKYVIKAPVKGRIVFIGTFQENQFISAEKIIGYVNPDDNHYFAQLTLSQTSFGKIAVGQMVQLHLDAYPYQEFGFVEGKLSYIAKVPSDSGFLAFVDLPKGLTTNRMKNIQYHSGLRSQALIVTRNSRLLQKFYYNIMKGMQR